MFLARDVGFIYVGKRFLGARGRRIWVTEKRSVVGGDKVRFRGSCDQFLGTRGENFTSGNDGFLNPFVPVGAVACWLLLSFAMWKFAVGCVKGFCLLFKLGLREL